MSQNSVEFKINLNGNAYTGVATLDAALGKLNVDATKTTSLFDRISASAIKLNNLFQLVSSTASMVASTFSSYVEANQVQQEAETKLAQVMRNTMDASQEEYQSILDLTAAQQKLGIVGDEVQLAGAQELGTYLEKSESLQKLIPVMNDMVAQQYGYNATQESAVNIATMMGKVIEGQTGALSRYGYKFDDAQEKVLKYGTEAEKVATLAEVISESVGGMNEALAQTPEGQMKQTANRIGDIQERVGRLYVSLQSALAPIIDTVIGIGERVMTYIEGKQPQIQTIVTRVNEAFQSMCDYIRERMDDIRGVIDNLRPVITGIFGVVRVAWTAFLAIAKAVIGTILTISNMVRAAAPFFIGLATAIGIVTVALKWQDIVLDILILKEEVVTAATNLWSGAQAFLNIIMTANPIGLIIAAIAILIGAIVAVCSHITGWGSLWDGICGFMKHTFMAYVEGVKLYFTTLVDGIMMGLDMIMLGWYKFKEACGIGSSEENQEAIAQINADVERRQQAIVDGAKKIQEHALAAKDALAGIEMGWKGKDKTEEAQASLGTNEQLQQAVNGGVVPGTGNNPKPDGKETGKTAKAVATGGTRKTEIRIDIHSLIEKVQFNGSTAENIQQIQDNITQALLQALNMAQTSVS